LDVHRNLRIAEVGEVLPATPLIQFTTQFICIPPAFHSIPTHQLVTAGRDQSKDDACFLSISRIGEASSQALAGDFDLPAQLRDF
jgi:hypothetical protein